MNLIAIFFVLASLLAWSTYEQMDYGFASAAAVAAGFLAFAWLFLRSEEKKRKEFMGWLADNSKALLDGQKLTYQGAVIHRDTPIFFFQTCVSFLVATTKIVSRPLIANVDNLAGAKASYTIIAALLGWWGFPWGFIQTPQVLLKNIKGGEQGRVCQLLAASPSQAIKH